jgi:hypothetical protein
MGGPGGVSFPTASPRRELEQKPKPNAKDFSDIGVSDEDRRKLLEILRLYRTSWSPDRIERFRIWSRNALFRKGIQYIVWDPGNNNWIDALAEYRKSGEHEGEDTNLEPFISNVTLASCMIYTTTLTGATPQTVPTPTNWREPADVRSAKKAATAIRIVQKRNKIAGLVQKQFESQFDFGCYFRHVRAVTSGDLAGWDQQAAYADFDVNPGPRMKCPKCGTETPVDGKTLGAGQAMSCPQCAAALGPECYYGEGEGAYTSLKMTGMTQTPRAGVRISIETPMRVDMAPWAETVSESPILVWDREIDVGEAKMLNPDVADTITGGMSSATSPQAELEKLRRQEISSASGTQTVDVSQGTVTCSEAWMQPGSFYRTGDLEFGDRMREAFPQGLRMVNYSETTTEIEPAEVVKEWTHCPVMKGYGAYPPSPAERIVPFNMALNRANEIVDDHARRSSTGLNLAAAGYLDTDKMNKRQMPPGRLTPVPTSLGGKDQPIGNIVAHYDLPIDAQMWDYPMRIITQMMLVALLPPQLSGGGTQEDVPTMGGQQQQLERAMAVFRGLWGMAKEEQAEADANIYYWLQKLAKVGAIKEIWEVKKARGGAFTPSTITADDLMGNVEFADDQDQGLPATPEQLRQVMEMIFKECGGNQNPAAIQIVDEPANAEMMISSMAPGMTAPTESQRDKTLGDLTTLCEQDGDPTGAAALAAEPDLSDNLPEAISTCEKYLQEHASGMKTALDGSWQRCQRYLEQARDLDAAKRAAQAKREQAVQAASKPPEQGLDPAVQGEMQQLLQVAGPAIQRLLQLAQTDPNLTKGTATAQVAAGKEIVEAAIEGVKLAAK